MNEMPDRRCPRALLAFVLLALPATALAAGAQPFKLNSPAYKSGETIPARFTCTGAGISPPLAWSGAPKGTKSFAFILKDPDAPDPRAPKMTWTHWVLYDISAEVHKLAAGESRHLPPGTRVGENSWKRNDYGGPCPPIGRHHYVHVLYALDTVLPNLHHPDARALEAAMHGHILARATLIATYKKP
ncbi:MAG: YbhB/YbcL family Raf kinase inhibitor-like protein [Gammaproteobacteria bacterium]